MKAVKVMFTATALCLLNILSHHSLNAKCKWKNKCGAQVLIDITCRSQCSLTFLKEEDLRSMETSGKGNPRIKGYSFKTQHTVRSAATEKYHVLQIEELEKIVVHKSVTTRGRRIVQKHEYPILRISLNTNTE